MTGVGSGGVGSGVGRRRFGGLFNARGEEEEEVEGEDEYLSWRTRRRRRST